MFYLAFVYLVFPWETNLLAFYSSKTINILHLIKTGLTDHSKY